jgi:pyruvate carboxylase subunit B
VTANPIKITDTTFRDGHQSLMATRLRTSDMEPLAADMDAIGFHSMEVWGGATFDVTTRFLAEDPWERLRTFKRLMPNTPLMMLLRGQSLVGYRTYADDVVDAFVDRSAQAGIDVFRVFDALNDEQNLQRAADAIKRSGKHLQIAICYSVTEEGRLGGPIYNLDYFIERARRFQDMGADSICLKDMGGVMAPYDAYELVTALKPILDVPIQLHTHYTSGMASMTALKAIEAGIDIVDACLAPLALRTSQPAVEPIVVTLWRTENDTGLDLQKLLSMGDRLEAILLNYKKEMESPRAAVIDAKVLSHQIPGGMASNLISQLREADALDRLDEVLLEIPRTRKELGYPPLVTPMSQMVGSQSVSNVLFGRYEMVSEQVRDYANGLYGKAIRELDPQVVELAFKADPEGHNPISGRAADSIEPEMDAAREAIKDISSDEEDVLTYAMYPTTGLRFLRIKHGLEPVPDEMKPKDADGAKPARAPQGSAVQPVGRGTGEAPPKSANVRQFNVYVGDEFFRVEVDAAQPESAIGAASPAVGGAPGGGDEPSISTDESPIVAPLPGIVLRYEVEVGVQVQAGDPVVVLEAMKMENTLPSPVAGTVRALSLEPGATVAKDDILAIIAP